MDYFKSRIKGNHGLPWLDTRSNWQKASDAYFEELQELANDIDDVEALTTFISYMEPDECLSGYDFVLKRLKELRHYIIHEAVIDDKESLIESLRDIYERLKNLSTDAALYDDCGGDYEDSDDEFEDDNFEDDDFEDDDFEDDVLEDNYYEDDDFSSDSFDTDDVSFDSDYSDTDWSWEDEDWNNNDADDDW